MTKEGGRMSKVNHATTVTALRKGMKKEDVLSPGKIIWRRFKRNKVAMISLYVLIILILLAVLAPVLSPYGRDAIQLGMKEKPPMNTSIPPQPLLMRGGSIVIG